jgi:hypothetical protein
MTWKVLTVVDSVPLEKIKNAKTVIETTFSEQNVSKMAYKHAKSVIIKKGNRRMKHTKEEIVNALKVIKEECCGTPCDTCPFYSDKKGRCEIRSGNAPTNWEINKPEPETWRAFK